MDRAEPGDTNHDTRLYSPQYTPLKQMGDFGIGVGLYFSTLRFLTLLTLLAGFINIPVISYFAGSTYSDGQKELRGISFFTKGSAICTKTQWVLCEDCEEEYFPLSRSYEVDIEGTNQKLAMQNNCIAQFGTSGWISYGTLWFIAFGILVMDRFQKNMEIRFDEDEQTTQDYSITVSNPPQDARNPKEWRDFFESFNEDTHVTCCTIGLNNQALLTALVERRELLQNIRFQLPIGTVIDSQSLAEKSSEILSNRTCFQRLKSKIFPSVPEWYNKIKSSESIILKLSKQEYLATTIFITFETEEAQRRVLKSMAKSEFLFRTEVKLKVEEADEPSSIMWNFLNVRGRDKVKICFFTFIATLAGLVLASFVAIILKNESAVMGTICIALTNQVFPRLALFLTNFEKHASRDTLEVSLYIKIVIFRWVNTAIVTTITSKSPEILDEKGLIKSVFMIFVAEIVTSNVIQLLDLGGNFKRHILAPRAQSQEKMNGYMMGADYFLAERYTNVTKILFLALWYATLYPATYFLCAASLFINYFSDRFSLMRTWRQIGKVGPKISVLSRRVFCTISVVLLAYHGTYIWAGFPFDNLCNTTRTTNLAYNSTYSGKRPDSKDRLITIIPGDSIYKYCDAQQYMIFKDFPYLPIGLGKTWMSEDQELLVSAFGITFLVMMGICVILYFTRNIVNNFGTGGAVQSVGEDQGIPFSKIDSVCGYIPEVKSNVIAYPLIACHIDRFDHELFEWQDPEISYEHYDLTKDVDTILQENNEDGENSNVEHRFSTISHWPPKNHDSTST